MSSFFNDLLNWYDANARSLPWRRMPPRPYDILVSEFMLQQTTVKTVIPYFQRFMAAFPTVHHLAQASLDDIYQLWQGLGYYARARNLRACAQAIVTVYGGHIPEDVGALQSLPGIGPYTAAAIAAMAFEKPVVPVDGNIIRVVARVQELGASISHLKKPGVLGEAVHPLTPSSRYGDFAQALMDLGATICTPRKPLCSQCPVQSHCQAYAQGRQEHLPVPDPQPVRPLKKAFVFWITDAEERIWVRQRPPKGLLAGFMELPSTPWVEEETPLASHLPPYLEERGYTVLPHSIRHVFTHFQLHLTPVMARLPALYPQWVTPAQLTQIPFPTLMKKVIRLCQTHF